MNWKPLFLAALIWLLVILLISYIDTQAMRVCQLSHSFDTCYSTLNP